MHWQEQKVLSILQCLKKKFEQYRYIHVINEKQKIKEEKSEFIKTFMQQ